MLAVLAGSTRATVVFFTNFGSVYTTRIIDVPASTGYGEPVQSLFKFKDGERVVAAVSLDPRVAANITAKKEGDAPPTHMPLPSRAMATACGSASSRLSRSARARAAGSRASVKGAEVVGVSIVQGEEVLIAATRQARALLCKVERSEFPVGAGPGRHPDQARTRTRIGCWVSWRRAATGIC